MAIEACHDHDPCYAADLAGDPSLPLDDARTAAFEHKLATAPNTRLVAKVVGGYTSASGLAAAQDVLQATSALDVMVGSSQAIEGAELAVKRAGRTPQIAPIGNGGSCHAVAGVRSGRWYATYGRLRLGRENVFASCPQCAPPTRVRPYPYSRHPSPSTRSIASGEPYLRGRADADIPCPLVQLSRRFARR